MDFLNLLVIITGIGNLLLGSLVFIRGAKNRITFSLAGFAIIGGLWSLALYLYHAQFIFSGLVWIKIVYTIVVFMVFGLFYFSSVFTRKSQRYIISISSLYFIRSVPLLYVLFFTKLWIVGVVTKSWGPETVLGCAYIPVCAFWTFFLILAVYHLMGEYFSSTGIARERVKYVLLGTAFYSVIVVTADAIIPVLWGNTRYFRVSPLSISFFVGLTVYAIFRYRLMDIKVILTEMLVGIMGVSLIVLPFLSSDFNFRVLTSVIFIVYCIIGYLLVKSTRREIDAKENLEQKVSERTQELQMSKDELEKFYKLTIGREMRMAELKEKIKEMEDKTK